jgi:paraquat-inducible protein B
MSRSKRANPALVGAFVLGALILTVAGLTIFASGKFFRRTDEYVAVFSGSVNGLSVGAPVKFRGVQVGSVSEILLTLPGMTLPELRIPVILAIDRDTLKNLGVMERQTRPDTMNALVDRGLRAQLQLESIVTGVLFIELDLFPNTPVNLYLPENGAWVEIPTQPTLLQEATATAADLVAKLRNLDLEEVVTSLRDAARGVSEFTGSPELRQTLVATRQTMEAARETLTDVRPRIAPLARRVDTGVGQMEESLKRLDGTLASLRTTLGSLDQLIDPRAPLVYQLTTTLGDLSDAARSIRQFADYLDRNPNALITGRPPAEEPTR